MARDTVRIVDQDAAGPDHRLEFLHRLLVQDDGRIELVGDRRRNLPVRKDYRHIGRTTAHLGAVRGHPRDFEVLHYARVGQYLPHREDALAPEPCDN